MVKITRLEPQKNNPERLNVYLEGEFGFGIARAVAPWLQVGRELTAEEIQELKFEDQQDQAYQRALHFLSYRPRSEAEIQRNLRKHDLPEEVIQAVLDRLRDQTLVNDQEFAAQWVENRAAFRPRGKKALASELSQKGVSRQIIDHVLEEVDEEAMARKLARKKLPRVSHLDREEFFKKLYGYLSRKGFHYSLCNQLVNQLWEEKQQQS
jgi:regulatory protein